MFCQQQKERDMPKVSVIIPVYNSAALLKRCLLSLQNQRFYDYQVCVIDDGSEPPITELAYWQDLSPRFQQLRLPYNCGRAHARNAGIQQATGDLLLFLDADMQVETDFIWQHWRFHQLKGPGWIGQGQVIGTADPQSKAPPSIWTDASQAFFATGNVSIAREALLAQAFDEDFSEYGWEDLELGFRLKQAGFRSHSVKQAIAWHYEPLNKNWAADLHKEYQRGRGAALFLQKHLHWEVRLMTQLTPLHAWLDRLQRSLLPEKKMLEFSQALEQKQPKLALAIYRGLLNHYALESAQQAWKDLHSGRD